MATPDLGKTEAWYVIQAEPGAKIYAGLKRGVTKSDLAKSLKSGQVEPLLHVMYPQAGDCVFIPAGTVHALGDGLLVAEIQQASDTTFRLFDWNRVGPDGLPRPLHIDESLEVIQFDMPTVEFCRGKFDPETGLEQLVSCDKFILERVQGEKQLDIPDDHRFRIVTVPQGRATLIVDQEKFELSLGQSALLPASRDSTNSRFRRFHRPFGIFASPPWHFLASKPTRQRGFFCVGIAGILPISGNLVQSALAHKLHLPTYRIDQRPSCQDVVFRELARPWG